MYKESLLPLELMCRVTGKYSVFWQALLYILKRKGKSNKDSFV